MPTYATVNVPSLGEIQVPVGLHINGEWVESVKKETFATVNPATGQKLLDFQHAQGEDIDIAVKAARKAFKTTWGNTLPAAERGALLNKLADLVERDADKLAALESLNSGKGVRIAREADIADTIACIRYFAGLADKIHGQSIDTFGGEKFAYTLHQPIGVCGQIIPWNYPQAIFVI
ncbi:hypothetical protein L198_01460 [Cryptococcus wingfieldii CBS 7118]|uniref:aldehyde dehydrogenase (NAD(+)) n=1 Tax=Cryptococcus wingfieldii CBS 7118 TaxID=1295528 RepID=A0A1E3JZB4_9TREE|nr:hypothetical protein L198_01460 [Cryptococcus wingfieldii CBS 7118]ODO06228.1 hypothetical protein L198_01460 [Cryptococcus wingfieldii CBS 7118]